MGVSTDAILFYGFCWDEEDAPDPWMIGREDETEPFEANDEDWMDRYMRLTGDPKPPGDHDSEWYQRRMTVEKTLPVRIGMHCSNECQMAYVAITESEVSASRGNPETVSPPLVPMPGWHAELIKFCKLMGIPTNGPQGWWLVSMWCH